MYVNSKENRLWKTGKNKLAKASSDQIIERYQGTDIPELLAFMTLPSMQSSYKITFAQNMKSP